MFAAGGRRRRDFGARGLCRIKLARALRAIAFAHGAGAVWIAVFADAKDLWQIPVAGADDRLLGRLRAAFWFGTCVWN